MSSAHESLARERKAAALVCVAVKAGMTADEAAVATVEQRKLAAWAAKCHPPSEQTWALVVSALRRYEEMR